MLQKVVVILGQTAVGKSDIAVKIAKKLGGEVISADSRQVYKGLDIGTGKITKKEMSGIPHHLLDVALPKKQFTVEEYKKLAEQKIEEIAKRGKLPIICGGTGFYIQTLVDNVQLPEIKPNPKLRKELGKKSVEELFKILKKLDPKRAKDIDPKNHVRIIRAIEIAKALGKVPEITKGVSKYKVLKIGITMDQAKLKDKIRTRLISRIKDGMINEAKKLHKNGLSYPRMEELGLEYRYMARFLNGKMKGEEMVNELYSAIWQYAKRQKTWFKRDRKIKWFLPKDLKKVEKEVRGFIVNKHSKLQQ